MFIFLFPFFIPLCACHLAVFPLPYVAGQVLKNERVTDCEAALLSSWKLQRYCIHVQLVSDRWKTQASDGVIAVM